MTREEVQALADLARRVGMTPRQVLIQAARCASDNVDEASDMPRRLRPMAMKESAISSDCANLLLTSVASFAKTEFSDALEIIHQDIDQARQ